MLGTQLVSLVDRPGRWTASGARRAATLLGALCLVLPAAAQVDLPERKPGAGSGSSSKPAARGDRDRRGLQLPSGSPVVQPPKPPRTGERGIAVRRAETLPEVELGEAAAYVLEQLDRLNNPSDRLVDQAVESLCVMGSPGLQASRRALRSQRPASLVAAARTLLLAGTPEDGDLVQTRLKERVPREACMPLLDAVMRDPQRGTVAYLARLLEHPQAPVRQGAFRHLADRLGAPGVLEELAPRLESEQSDTRLRAVQLLERLDDSRSLGLLIDVLGDSSARVAFRAASALARGVDERIDAALVNRAFGRPWILRENAYALLAIVEREDELVQPILDLAQVDPLLQGLDSSDPFISGVCAAALAGIGFRSADVESTEWLDEEVAHALVRAVSGRVFHNDFTSLHGAAIRRLTLISGESYASDGPAWVDWWARESRWFTAHRARIPVDPERVGTLRLEVAKNGAARTDAFALLGPDAIWQGGEGSLRVGETLYVTRNEAADLLAVLQREGVLGAERLPGRRGSDGPGARSLVLVLDGRSKAFHFGSAVDEAWFDEVLHAADLVRDRNRWQRYFVPGVHASSLELWLDDAGWWEAEQDPAARNARLKQSVLAWLAAHPTSERQPGLDELKRLDAADALVAKDFSPLLELLRDELRSGPRSRALVALLLSAARRAAGSTDDELAPIPSELAVDLIDAHVASLGAGDEATLASVVAAAGPAFAREVAQRPEPELRRAAAQLLGDAPTEADVDVLNGLLEDPDPSVELAAVEALGRGRVESAREELLVRARIASTRIRAAALSAIGVLGGDNVLDALVIGLTDPDPSVQAAAASGLADLADPRSASLLVSLLGQGRAAGVVEPVRRGLLTLGPAAHADLLRAVHGPSPAAKRGAALLLAYQGVPQVASTLMSVLTENPEDAEVAAELAVLTGMDLRGEPDPAGAWWKWWDLVVHDDSIAWFCAGLERSGVSSPVPDALRGRGTAEGARFLLALSGGKYSVPAHLSERARRELERMLGHAVELPAGEDNTAAIAQLVEELEERWR